MTLPLQCFTGCGLALSNFFTKHTKAAEFDVYANVNIL